MTFVPNPEHYRKDNPTTDAAVPRAVKTGSDCDTSVTYVMISCAHKEQEMSENKTFS